MLNKVQLIGYVGADPAEQSFQSGAKVAKFRFATQKVVESMGTPETRTVWHSIACWNKTADYAVKRIKKGDKCYIEGELCYDTYTDKNNSKHTVAYISASKIIQLTKKGGEDNTTAPVDYEMPHFLSN